MSAMECSNQCGPLYERDGQWWCLNNYCEHSYFWGSDTEPIPRLAVFLFGFAAGGFVCTTVMLIAYLLQ